MRRCQDFKMRALITGITGQDGSYLAEFLLSKGYEVFGIERRVAIEDQSKRNGRIFHLLGKIKILPCDITNYSSVFSAISEIKPDEVYHLAAQSFVALSFDAEFETYDANVTGTLNILNSLRKIKPDAKFYFAGSSEMFGKVRETPQTEKTPFHPRSPYGITKVTGFEMTRNYRESYGMFACSGILFNHESPRRGMEFVTRKITRQIARIKAGLETELRLGNLDAKRDWGFSGDYVKAMWLMLQHEHPDDYVIATGETHSIQEFVEKAFGIVGLDWKKYVVIDKNFLRPAEVDILIGDSSKAKKELGWAPEVYFGQLVEMMVKADIESVKNSK